MASDPRQDYADALKSFCEALAAQRPVDHLVPALFMRSLGYLESLGYFAGNPPPSAPPHNE